MMYPFMTLNDDTEITHSEMKPDGKVKVYFETPDLFAWTAVIVCISALFEKLFLLAVDKLTEKVGAK